MSNRDYDRDLDRRDPSRLRFFDDREDPMNRMQGVPDRGGYSPAYNRPYPERGPMGAEEYPPRYAGREDQAAYQDYSANGNVTIHSPKSYSDVQDMIDNLTRGESIIVNLEGIESSSAQRILDFLSGAAYALGGSMRRVKEMHSTFLITPHGTGITDTDDDRYSR